MGIFGGVTLLPFHIIFVVAVALLFFGIKKKMILITNLAAIAMVMIGLFGMINGYPCATGSREITYSNGTVVTTQTITNRKNLMTDMTAIAATMVGCFMLLYVNFKQWEELGV
jgi:hypothetical protein